MGMSFVVRSDGQATFDPALVPMYGDHPIELGLDRSDDWLSLLRRDDVYAGLFQAAFPGNPEPVTGRPATVLIPVGRQFADPGPRAGPCRSMSTWIAPASKT